MSTYTLNDLVYLMSRLRDPEKGCPWDQKQDYGSISHLTIEEAYEVVDAIEREDWEHLPEELGDLLFHIIFYAQLGKEHNHFSLDGVIDNLVKKLVRRHPHVFGPTLYSEPEISDLDVQAVTQQWEVIKQAERASKGQKKIIDDIPVSMPALTRAVKVQKRAKSVGFDWPELGAVFDCLQSEVAELAEALASKDERAIADEMGDVFFTLVNLSRHLKCDPEKLVRQATAKFTRRLEWVEEAIDGDWASNSSEQLHHYWCLAKEQEKST